MRSLWGSAAAMRHIPWCRLGTVVVLIGASVLLVMYSRVRGGISASGMQQQDAVHQSLQLGNINVNVGVKSRDDNSAASGVAVGAAVTEAGTRSEPMPESKPVLERKPGDVSDDARRVPSVGLPVGLRNDDSEVGESVPRSLVDRKQDAEQDKAEALYAPRDDRKVNLLEGLPVNIAVDIAASSKVAAPAAADPSALPKEATLEDLKKHFEPDLTDRRFNGTRVLVVTPLRNARGHLQHYLDLLRSLSYPHDLISVALGEDSSIDGTFELASSMSKQSLADFRRVSVFHFDQVLHQGTDWASVHAEGHQLARRGHLARARNELLSRALLDEDFVLWVDSDVGSWPSDIVQHLLDAHVDIVAPACMYRSNEGRVDVYDRNTWRETEESLGRQAHIGEDELMLEGYGQQPRLYLPDLRSERQRLVSVDGVGGCVLLVRSIIHRRGLIFPSFPFRHHVETEGLAKVAKAMGHQSYGMPFLEVFHL